MTAADLTAELRDTLNTLPGLSKETHDELCLALDRVVDAAVAEARGPAVTGDVFALVREAMCATPQHFFLQDRTARLIEELTKRGVVVLGKGDYDELVKRGRETELGEKERHIAAAWILDRADQYRNDSCCKVAVENLVGPIAQKEHHVAYVHGELDDLLPRVRRRSASPASRAEGRKG